MSKFKIKLELTGLKLGIEGSRDDIPLITQNLGQQVAGLMRPAGAIVSGELLDDGTVTEVLPPAAPPVPAAAPRKSGRKRTSGTKASGASKATTEEAIDWRHDPGKYGTPK